MIFEYILITRLIDIISLIIWLLLNFFLSIEKHNFYIIIR